MPSDTASAETETGEKQNEHIVNPDDFEETIHMVCPECGLDGEVPSEWEGLTIECKDCDEQFTVTNE